MRSKVIILGTAALSAALAGSSPAQPICGGPCSDDFVAYELKDKEAMNQPEVVTSPFTTGSILLTRTHRLLVPAGLNGAPVANPVVHYLGVEINAGSYDSSTTPKRMFSTSLGTVTFNPGSVKFFYDPTTKSLSAPLPPPPPATPPMLCFAARSGSKSPKPDVSTTDQFGTQHPSLTGLDYACVNVSLGGPAPAEAWIVCFNQKTRDALDPPDVWLTTQDLGQFPDMRVDPVDEVCVQATVQP